jgi:hypothetical protein
MKCTVEMDSYDMLYIKRLINIGSNIHTLLRRVIHSDNNVF